MVGPLPLLRLLGVADDAIRTDVPQHPEIWGDLTQIMTYEARMLADAQAVPRPDLAAR